MDGDRISLRAQVTLRPLLAADAASLLETVNRNRAHICRWMRWPDQLDTEAATRAFLEHSNAVAGADVPPQRWGIMDGVGLVGGVNVINASPPDRCCEVAYWLAQDAAGRGLARAAVAALIEHLPGRYGLRRFEIRCATANTRSRRIPEALGFQQEGLLRSAHVVGNQLHDVALYSLVVDREASRRA